MNRSFDSQQKILLAVEFADQPSALIALAGHSVFRRLNIAEIKHAVRANPSATPDDHGDAFHSILHQRMGYWEQRAATQKCFVHYAIGAASDIEAEYARLQARTEPVLLGIYHLEPQCSAYPASFPFSPAPNHLRPGELNGYDQESVFWFNFFPAQPYLFEKTFSVWARFVISAWADGGGCNQLVASDDAERRLTARGVERFVQVNLNRFGSLRGFFASAQKAGEQTFSIDQEYTWYGMLLRKA